MRRDQKRQTYENELPRCALANDVRCTAALTQLSSVASFGALDAVTPLTLPEAATLIDTRTSALPTDEQPFTFTLPRPATIAALSRLSGRFDAGLFSVDDDPPSRNAAQQGSALPLTRHVTLSHLLSASGGFTGLASGLFDAIGGTDDDGLLDGFDEGLLEGFDAGFAAGGGGVAAATTV